MHLLKYMFGFTEVFTIENIEGIEENIDKVESLLYDLKSKPQSGVYSALEDYLKELEDQAATFKEFDVRMQADINSNHYM